MISYTELQLLKSVLDQAQASDTGNHWLPERYAQDLRQCIRAVNRELKVFKPEVPRTFSVYCGARNVYLDHVSSKLCAYWNDVANRKKHPSLKAALTWIPTGRKDPEWEMAIHEFHGDELVAKHKI